MPPLSRPPLTALRAFEAAIRHGRMTRAAEELGVTHGAISRQVRLLEDTFGTPLMTRTQSGLVPTEAGAALAQRLARGFREIEAGVDLLRSDAVQPLLHFAARGMRCPVTSAMNRAAWHLVPSQRAVCRR